MAVFLFQLDGFSKVEFRVKQYVHSNFNSSIVILSQLIMCLLALESISFLVFSNLKDTLNIAIVCVIVNNNQGKHHIMLTVVWFQSSVNYLFFPFVHLNVFVFSRKLPFSNIIFQIIHFISSTSPWSILELDHFVSTFFLNKALPGLIYSVSCF